MSNVSKEVLEAEMDTQLGYDKYDISEKQTENSRNGYSKKTIKSELGSCNKPAQHTVWKCFK